MLCSYRVLQWLFAQGEPFGRMNPFATGLFTVCSAVTVECCVLYPCCMGMWYVCCYVKKKALLQCLQLLRRGIWASMWCPCHVFIGFWNEDYVSQLPYVWYYVGVKSSFQHASPMKPMCFGA